MPPQTAAPAPLEARIGSESGLSAPLFYLPFMAVYTLERISFVKCEDIPANPLEVIKQLHGHGDYLPGKEEVERMIFSPTTITVNHGGIGLRGEGSPSGFLIVNVEKERLSLADTRSTRELEPDEEMVIRLGYGRDSLGELQKASIKCMHATLLKQGYVNDILRPGNVPAIARPCMLERLGTYSLFHADDQLSGFYDALHAMTSKGNRQERIDYTKALNVVLGDTIHSFKTLDVFLNEVIFLYHAHKIRHK